MPPRLRGLEERFESRILPLFRRRTEQVGELLPQLYLHGLAQGDFELALRGLLGKAAPLSPSSIERLRAKWVAEFEAWRSRSLRGLAADISDQTCKTAAQSRTRFVGHRQLPWIQLKRSC